MKLIKHLWITNTPSLELVNEMYTDILPHYNEQGELINIDAKYNNFPVLILFYKKHDFILSKLTLLNDITIQSCYIYEKLDAELLKYLFSRFYITNIPKFEYIKSPSKTPFVKFFAHADKYHSNTTIVKASFDKGETFYRRISRKPLPLGGMN